MHRGSSTLLGTEITDISKRNMLPTLDEKELLTQV